MTSAVAGARGADHWARLKAGMTPEQVVTVLGAPLFKNHGHGFEVWIYDGGAEVVCWQGQVMAWTAPRVNPAAHDRQNELSDLHRPPTRPAAAT